MNALSPALSKDIRVRDLLLNALTFSSGAIVGRDFGTRIEIVRGVTPSDKVILNPADSLVTGDVVHLAAPPSSSPATELTKR